MPPTGMLRIETITQLRTAVTTETVAMLMNWAIGIGLA